MKTQCHGVDGTGVESVIRVGVQKVDYKVVVALISGQVMMAFFSRARPPPISTVRDSEISR